LKNILVIGQVPPPYGGQALMIQTLLSGKYLNANLYHVNLDFSRNFDDMGSFKLYKFWALFKVIILTWYYRFQYNINVVYYGPAGPNKLAVYRDVLLLIFTRFLFKKIILHSHAGGSSKAYPELNIFMRYLYRKAFFNPDILIVLTEFSHGDDVLFMPKKVCIVPNGIKDEYPLYSDFLNVCRQRNKEVINLLYVGALYKERGILELLDSVHFLIKKKISVNLRLMGIFISKDFELETKKYVDELGIKEHVFFIGTKINHEKWQVFCESDIFCFPTFVPSETFGLVLVESMQFKIPIVASRWNGIPHVFKDGREGLLVNPGDSLDLAEKIEILIVDENLRRKMGDSGREEYLNKFTVNNFIQSMDKVFEII
jgi:glycosyltransferase involved in cell wall biosynthesis